MGMLHACLVVDGGVHLVDNALPHRLNAACPEIAVSCCRWCDDDSTTCFLACGISRTFLPGSRHLSNRTPHIAARSIPYIRRFCHYGRCGVCASSLARAGDLPSAGWPRIDRSSLHTACVFDRMHRYAPLPYNPSAPSTYTLFSRLTDDQWPSALAARGFGTGVPLHHRRTRLQTTFSSVVFCSFIICV